MNRIQEAIVKVNRNMDFYSNRLIRSSNDVVQAVPKSENKDLIYLLNVTSIGQIIRLNVINSVDFQPYNFPEIIKNSIKCNSAGMVVCRNIPEAGKIADINDENIQKLYSISELVGIKLLDFIEYNNAFNCTVSFSQQDRLICSRNVSEIINNYKQNISLGGEEILILSNHTSVITKNVYFDEIEEILIKEHEEYDREHFEIINFNEDGKAINFNVVSIGELSSTVVHPREVFKSSILSNAKNVVMSHNHPSGNALPSSEDLQVTRRLMKVADVLGINLAEHIITGDGKAHRISQDISELFLNRTKLLNEYKRTNEFQIKVVNNIDNHEVFNELEM